MAKPTINKIIPFDACIGAKITMTYFGDMAYSNTVIVYDAESMSKVFEDTIVSFSLDHNIPSYALQNGMKYAIQSQVFDREGIPSALSDKQYFWCFETPSFYFSNLTYGDIIKSASYNATLIYEQADWEDISSYKFQIYNSSKVLLNESSVFYNSDDISYSFRGLENENVYYIRCIGSTVNCMELDTGFIKIDVRYDNPNTYARIYAECDKHTGIVNYRTNFKAIESAGNEKYDYNNGVIDLVDKTLTYNDGFVVENDFTMVVRGKNLYHTGVLLTPSNDKYGFTLSSYIYDEGKLRYKLSVPNGVCNYILYSDELVFDEVDMVTIILTRINNIFKPIECYIEYGFKEQTNMWISSVKPSESLMTQYDIWIDIDTPNTVKVDKDNVTVLLQDNMPEDASQYTVWIGGDTI